MPDTRSHRGPHPEDEKLFATTAWPTLQRAVAELSWLFSRDYAAPSALKLVGDRHQLAGRQRMAVARSACSDRDLRSRRSRQVGEAGIAGRELWLDGYNVLTTIEVALGRGVILRCRDGTYRDIASMHGTYRKVEETVPALRLLGRIMGGLGSSGWIWLLDRPVSNSGRLRGLILELAEEQGWRWKVELVQNPDRCLAEANQVIATADSAVLDRGRGWFNLARLAVDSGISSPRVVPMAAEAGGPAAAPGPASSPPPPPPPVPPPGGHRPD